MENKKSITLGNLLLALLIVTIIILVYYFFPVIKDNLQRIFPSKQQISEELSETPIPTPTRKPNYKLPEGPQSYNFSHGDNVTGPRVSTVSFSPLAAKKDTTQTVSAVFPAGEAVSSVVFSYDTDNLKNQKLELSKKPNNPSIWEGTWTMPDTTDNIYNVRLIFLGNSGVYDEVMKFFE